MKSTRRHKDIRYWFIDFDVMNHVWSLSFAGMVFFSFKDVYLWYTCILNSWRQQCATRRALLVSFWCCFNVVARSYNGLVSSIQADVNQHGWRWAEKRKKLLNICASCVDEKLSSHSSLIRWFLTFLMVTLNWTLALGFQPPLEQWILI